MVARMRFETDAMAPMDQPKAEHVEQGLRALQSGQSSAFAILSLSPDRYIQTQLADGRRFVLEFDDGLHYQAVELVPLDKVIAAFLSYLRQDGAWRSAFAWERVEL
jgi:hypothetical protein